MNANLTHLYDYGCDKCSHEQDIQLKMDARFKRLLKTVERAFKKLHKNGSYSPEDLSEIPEYADMIIQTNGFLTRALDDNDLSDGLVERLENDIFIFSGIKTHAQLFEASRQLLDDDKKIKSRERFLNDVKGVKESHRKYLEAEYDFATGSVLMADRWDNLSDSDRYFLQYRTASDDRVRESHRLLHNVTLPKEDPFWDKYFPPNGWRCRCNTVQVLKATNEKSDSKKAIKNGEKSTTKISKSGKNKLEIFRFNPGKKKVVFPPKHPYHKVKGSRAAKKAINDLNIDE